VSSPAVTDRPPQEESAQDVHRAGSGPALPTWAVTGSLLLALVAALAFFITGPPDPTAQVTASSASDRAARNAEPSNVPEEAPQQDVRGRGDGRAKGPTRTATVDVYNNAGVAGLAASTGAELRALGWTVGIEDNWYGTIPKSTVYYPAVLADEAKVLAKDLGIPRTRPATSPMSFERLTVILTR
jgi:hypothetical protein